LLLYGALPGVYADHVAGGLSPGATPSRLVTLQAQVPPIAGTIRSQIIRSSTPGSSKQADASRSRLKLAANDRSSSATRRQLPRSPRPTTHPGVGGGSGGGNSQSLVDQLHHRLARNTFFRDRPSTARPRTFSSAMTSRGRTSTSSASRAATKRAISSPNSMRETKRRAGTSLNPYFAW